MTLPSLIAKHEKDTTVTQLKKVYSVMSQALIRSENENGSAYIDLNGPKNPNILGKDVFYFSIDLKNHQIVPPNIDSTETGLIDTCKSVGTTCSTLIMRNGWRITDKYPW